MKSAEVEFITPVKTKKGPSPQELTVGDANGKQGLTGAHAKAVGSLELTRGLTGAYARTAGNPESTCREEVDEDLLDDLVCRPNADNRRTTRPGPN